MKEVSYLDYANHLDAHATDVLANGEIISVQHPSGTFVIMEEAEYRMMRDAMELLIHSATKK